MVDKQFQSILQGHSVTTAEILYRLPDFQDLLQTYIWQEYDTHPKFPKLHKFLVFWEENLEGPIHSVCITHTKLITPSEFRFAKGEFFLN
ncbi:MAG: aspartate-semialdehyde dehydrogenase [Candidatus Pacebacteria bacterium]|nr:aspartate-semialdehyde dehydrogenase [Candidatus Paceibacterota bacterium]